MKLYEYAGYDGVGLRELIVAGEVTAAEVEEVAREALETVNENVNGLGYPLLDPALDHDPHGPLGGVPFLIKDSGPVAAGLPFCCGSRAVPDVPAARDTELMTRFRAAGLVTLGVTTVPEMLISFATESARWGPTRNPWAPERGAGGSSGGSAALVAAGAVPIAHANDGAGSTRVPASCCGLVGLKPSRGRTPVGPDQGEAAFGNSYESVVTRTVRDSAHVLDAVQGPAVGDKYTAPPPARPYADELGTDPGRLRVAVTTRAWSGADVDPEVAAATVRTGRVLAEMGHEVTEDGPDVDWEEAMRVLEIELVAIGAMFLHAPRPPEPAMMEAVSREVLRHTRACSALDLAAAFATQNRITRKLGGFLTRYDLLVTPTLAQLPAPHGTLRYDDPEHTVRSWLDSLFAYGPFTGLFNITGQPAISLPLGRSRQGLPIGVQLIAPYAREDRLFQIATTLEAATPWHHHRPPIHAGRP